MKNSFLISYSFLRFQSMAYLFVIFWTTLIANVPSMFVIWKYTELMNGIVFFIFLFVVLLSVIVLIMQVLKIYSSQNQDNSIIKKVWIVVNIVLYYLVVGADLYIVSQFRF
ncbi:hypothetical protein [Flavobacterium hungaricum]|uniref:Uncharacterized protein n=1 Tax=Flavobacterium hungaricum TaxID=2082725 RepID=A0ABR9THM8_9FLAO|nr:hypothetical protein [Flavobacterium hungaricum]MBE8724177.1 hypothetical protein [Flavobacterium hungaricum]